MSAVSSVCVSGRFVFSGSLDGALVLWRLEFDAGGRVNEMGFVRELQAHEGAVNKACLLDEDEENTFVATCGNDKKIKVWSVDNRRQVITSFTNIISGKFMTLIWDNLFLHNFFCEVPNYTFDMCVCLFVILT